MEKETEKHQQKRTVASRHPWLSQAKVLRLLDRVKHLIWRASPRMHFAMFASNIHPQLLSAILVKSAMLVDSLSVFPSHFARPNITLNRRQRFAAWLVSLASPLERAVLTESDFELGNLELLRGIGGLNAQMPGTQPEWVHSWLYSMSKEGMVDHSNHCRQTLHFPSQQQSSNP